MMRTAPFHSRDVFYKSIFGSVEAHRAFRLSVLLPRDGYVLGVVAVFDRDGTGERRFELLDDGNGLEGGFYTRSCEISLGEGLSFYRFIMYTVEGERNLLNKGGGLGEFDPPGGLPWQLTVYEAGFETPKNTRGGIIYQIFPDRFFRGKINYPIPRIVCSATTGAASPLTPKPPHPCGWATITSAEISTASFRSWIISNRWALP